MFHHSNKVSDFYYDLPNELIAQEPLNNREMSKLMVIDKNRDTIEHRTFRDIVDYFDEGDCIVLNDTKVIPARLLGKKEDTQGKIEFVLLKSLGNDLWEVILKPGKRAKQTSRFIFGDGLLKAQVVDIVYEGNRIVRFEYEGIFGEILDQVGQVPLPPYIIKKLEDKGRYQTVYSKHNGSIAAPTAGLHFTKELLETLKNKGVKIVFVTLHVGLGTFRPVKVENILEHKMHSEFFEINKEACYIINSTKNNSKKVVAVGTTSCRVLESVYSDVSMAVEPGNGYTDIFIYPGYRFKVVDSLITNFHLPESTLIMLVSAFYDKQKVLDAYQLAIDNRYRFFSFGDAMLIRNS